MRDLLKIAAIVVGLWCGAMAQSPKDLRQLYDTVDFERFDQREPSRVEIYIAVR